MSKTYNLKKFIKTAITGCALLAAGTGSSFGGGAIIGGGDSTTIPGPLAGTVSGEAFSIDLDLKVDIGDLLNTSLLNLGGLLDLNGDVATIKVGPFPHVKLSPYGGADSETVASINLLDLVNSLTLTNSTAGGVGSDKAGSSSSSVVEDLNLLGLIQADVIGSYCTSFGDGVSAGSVASSRLVGLKIGGKSISASTPPNTTIDLFGKGFLGKLIKVGKVVINEQIEGGDGVHSSSITNNALHVSITTPKILSILLGDIVSGDIIVSSAHCDVDASIQDGGDPPGNIGGSVTGNGELFSPMGVAAFNFAVSDGVGTFRYIDDRGRDNPNLDVESEMVTSFQILDQNCVTFSGTAAINGQSGHTYTVTTCDFADPGDGIDTLDIDLDTNGYHNSGTLLHGDVQLHISTGVGT